MSDVVIRTASLTDAFVVEDLRVSGWKTAYRGLLADAFLDSLEVDADMRATTMARGDATELLAVSDGTPVGMATFGPCRDDDRSGEQELYAIYVREPGRGIGGRLLEACGPVTSLWVLQGNAPAIGFYERHGFALDGSTQDLWLGDEQVRELRMLRHLG